MFPDPQMLERPAAAPSPRTSKRRPQARLRAIDGSPPAVADWASLFGDLARRPSHAPEADAPVEWRVHDRTHLEFAVDYPLVDRQPAPVPASRSHEARTPPPCTWEAYFFVPESFRLHEGTYHKKDIYEDLWSYVRYAPPSVPFYDLAALSGGSPLAEVRAALRASAGFGGGSPQAAEATRRLRLFACLVRASGLPAMREVEQEAPRDRALGATFAVTCGAVAAAFRRVLSEMQGLALPEEVRVAARWTDEDISLVLETFCASLGVSLGAHAHEDAGLGEVAEQLAAYAVKEARHRREEGYDFIGSAGADERGTEHLEFRRHVLKRFTASVLWLSLEVREAARWVVHALYAVAAAAAMAFALAANKGSARSSSFDMYALLIVVAYAAKDRLKALLQSVFAGWIQRRFPDRAWSIRDRERGRRVGTVRERAAFLPFRAVPAEVLARRRMTREHAMEEQARPERVLWHEKTVSLAPQRAGAEPPPYAIMTEIFRLNLRRWLAHADDPNRKIVFADPEDAQVYSVVARRVYNINVIYRLRAGRADAAWHRLRVVVSRKGIERIEPILLRDGVGKLRPPGELHRPLLAHERHREDRRRREPPRHVADQLVHRGRAHELGDADQRLLLERAPVERHPADRIDQRRDPAVRRPDEVAPVLDRAQLGEREVDPRLGRVAEPRVVGEVHEQVRIGVPDGLVDEGGEDVLVADEGGDAVVAEGEGIERGALGEVGGVRRQLVEVGQAVVAEDVSERDVLAEGEEVLLVVAAADAPVLAGEEGGVEVVVATSRPSGRGGCRRWWGCPAGS